MNKRQRKKKGLLDQTIKIGSRVLIVQNTLFGHEVGTIGNVVGKRASGNWTVLAPVVDYGKLVDFHHPPSDLKKLQNKGVRYYL